jgi:L-seryl-tRNA(Ser) seleniumtransferase
MASGVDLVTFSGDKLLGGPQAGIICGGARHVAATREHPLMRALRPDKLALAALEATLSLYRDDLAMDEIPVWAMLSDSRDALRVRAEDVQARVRRAANDDAGEQVARPSSGLELSIALTPCESKVGGGTMPLVRLPSYGLALRAVGTSARRLARALHDLPVPIIGRIVEERVLLDVRTVRGHDVDLLVQGLRALGAARKDEEPPEP